MPESGSVQAAAAVSVGQAVTVYTLFLPPLTEVRQATVDDPITRANVRTGQFGAAVVVVSVGFVLSNMTGSTVPVGMAMFMSLVIAAVYESAMRKEAP